jgi:hypothetical protein
MKLADNVCWFQTEWFRLWKIDPTQGINLCEAYGGINSCQANKLNETVKGIVAATTLHTNEDK